jgi:hypothetical protein
VRKERQSGPRWLLHCSHGRQGTSGKFTGKEKFQTRAKGRLKENVNKEDVGWTYGSCCSLLYGGQESNTADSPKRKDLNERQKGVLKTTQTQVTQSPKPKPRVTATDLMKGLRGTWFGGRGIFPKKGFRGLLLRCIISVGGYEH